MTSLVTCNVCNGQLADDAPTCPRCGTPGPRKKRGIKLKKLVWLFVCIFTAIVLGYIWLVLIPEIQQHGLFYKGS